MIDIKKVKEGDIFRFSVEKGYSKNKHQLECKLWKCTTNL